MASINLLPWREKRRARRKKEFGLMMVGGLLLTVVLLGYWHWYNESLINHQRDRNKFLEKEIAVLNKKIEEIQKLDKTRQQLVSRMKVVQNLQTSRPLVVHLFDEVVSTLPDGVYLTKLVQANNSVSLTGYAQSNARVSAYMRSIEASPWLSDPSLKIIEQKDKSEDSDATFQLDMKQVVANKEEDER